MARIRTSITGLALVGAIGLAGCSGAAGDAAGDEVTSADDLTGTVVMLLPNTTTTRFVEHDGPGFEKAMAEIAPNVKVDIQNAEGDAAKQLTQIETAVNQGVDGIVLVTADPLVSAAGLVRAGDADIPVISYEHEALDGPVAYQLMFDPYRVGIAQGEYLRDHLPETDGPLQLARVYGNAGDNYTTEVQRGQDEVLTELFDSGEIEVVCEDNAAGWDPANAQQLVEQCLTKTQNEVDAVLASNDGTASGTIAALEGQDMAGTVPVFGGLDANLEALKFVLEGKQEMTVFKNFPVMGAGAAELMTDALMGVDDSELINSTFDNGFGEIPAAMFEVEAVDAESMGDIVDAGLYTKEEICEGVTASGFCD
ncbi:substrate-binding domain-containing protein [Leucobacter sp. USHLN154]|uniref:substrate-binding domain-containing protein n=1 Tax=Leucobacter sp. USHLN154 TaxID=3081269 RepID=UPI003016BBBB